MAFAREIIMVILQFISFRIPKTQEKDSYYTEIGGTLLRISNHCTRLRVWDDILEKNPKWKRKPIISIVFEDNNSTFEPMDCLVLKRFRKRPINVLEVVYSLKGQPHFLTSKDVQYIISSIRNINNGQYIDKTNKCQPPILRTSQNPNRLTINTNITDCDNSFQEANGWDADYVSETKTIFKHPTKNTKKDTLMIEYSLQKTIEDSIRQTVYKFFNNNL